MTTATDELRLLRDDELDGVNGGLVVIAIIAILIGLPPAPPPTPFLTRLDPHTTNGANNDQ